MFVQNDPEMTIAASSTADPDKNDSTTGALTIASSGPPGGRGGAASGALVADVLTGPVRAENYIYAGQGTWRYSWMTQSRRSCRSLMRRSI